MKVNIAVFSNNSGDWDRIEAKGAVSLMQTRLHLAQFPPNCAWLQATRFYHSAKAAERRIL